MRFVFGSYEPLQFSPKSSLSQAQQLEVPWTAQGRRTASAMYVGNLVCSVYPFRPGCCKITLPLMSTSLRREASSGARFPCAHRSFTILFQSLCIYFISLPPQVTCVTRFNHLWKFHRNLHPGCPSACTCCPQTSLSLFEPGSLIVPWSSLLTLGLLVSKPQASTCLFLLQHGDDSSLPICAPGCLLCVLGIMQDPIRSKQGFYQLKHFPFIKTRFSSHTTSPPYSFPSLDSSQFLPASSPTQIQCLSVSHQKTDRLLLDNHKIK